VSDQQGAEPERTWLIALARETGRNVVYSLAQAPYNPTAYRDSLADAETLAAEGLTIAPMVSCRPTGMLFGLQSSLHPFITHPSYRQLADLPLAQRVTQLRDPAMRARLLAEDAATGNLIARSLMSRWDQMFPLGDPPEYEPAPETSVAATAEREGRSPEEVVLDWLLERDGKALVFAPLASYVDRDHEALREMMTHPRTVLGLSDGGAHCGLICDASMPTYLLTHWVRDRTRGPKLGLEETVRMQTGRTAAVYGLHDRGVIAPGKRADINVIDLDGLRLHAPEMVFDLPAGGRRLIQHVDGYAATVCAGAVTFTDGEATGERPGGLVRGGAQAS
jgi:N-acyl-D-aspartate/D-glutamate deacylase